MSLATKNYVSRMIQIAVILSCFKPKTGKLEIFSTLFLGMKIFFMTKFACFRFQTFW